MYINEPQEQAKACVIWMHGLGADASDMIGLSQQLTSSVSLKHIFLDAPVRPVTLNGGMQMPAWYDILGMKLVDREDKEGIEKSAETINKVIQEQYQLGFLPQQIILAGFSQGGAMALYTALHTPARLGGVVALSAYLPMAQQTQALLHQETPFFMAAGRFDSIVLADWTLYSKEWLEQRGYNHISYHAYPMEHSVCMDEIRDLSAWLDKVFEGVCE